MVLLYSLLFLIAASQNSFVQVNYNDQNIIVSNSDLTVSRLKAIFKITEFSYLEDLSGNYFYPYPDGSFQSSISTVVFVRQVLPKQEPLVIFPSESKFLFTAGPWTTAHTAISSGYNTGDKTIRRTFIQFKNLNSIDRKKKVSKVYLRLVGDTCESHLPCQLFVHRCEIDWQGIINWNQQPVFRPDPYSSIIVRETTELSFYFDVTDIVVDWVTAAFPNYGIAIKANNTVGLPTSKNFNNNHPIKKPALLVYYSD